MAVEQLTPRIYVTCLSAYNAGKLQDRWMPCDDVDTLQDSIKEASPEPDAEEWGIHDCKGFGSVSLSEYQSLESQPPWPSSSKSMGLWLLN
ncbi:antirestriction protein ArdA [Vampirovibrio sp.]|uniref:antirestriction protein ArdA n=1 Tax=Vampirovibrio sp. TaxID=2717857 RepID=UPI00359399E7